MLNIRFFEIATKFGRFSSAFRVHFDLRKRRSTSIEDERLATRTSMFDCTSWFMYFILLVFTSCRTHRQQRSTLAAAIKKENM